MHTAILVDGGFFRKRAPHLWDYQTPEELAKILQDYCWRHIIQSNIKHNGNGNRNGNTKYHHDEFDLYRVFYYDCPPSDKKIFHPLLQKQIDLKKSEQYQWNLTFFNELKKKRKFALRMGILSDTQSHYTIRYDVVKKLCNGKMTFQDLQEKDFELHMEQKGVDMKIGLDISSLAYKQQVQQIILISGDSDFVPAAKLARKEGIDFILDPLWAPIKDDLHEHIDGIRSCIKNPSITSTQENNEANNL